MRPLCLTLLRATLGLLLLWCARPAGADQSSLAAGDVMVVQGAADAPDTISFTPLVAIEAGTVIHFTDNARLDTSTGFSGWRLAGTDSAFSEFAYTWVAPSNFAAGSVISLNAPPHNLDFAGGGDTLLAFQGTIYRPQFVGGLGWAISDSFITTGTTNSNTSYLPSTLVLGSTAAELGNLDNYVYSGTNTGTKSSLQTAIGTPANWTANDTVVAAAPGPFTVTGATAAPDAATTIGGYSFGINATSYTQAPTVDTADLDLGTLSFVNAGGATVDSDGGNGFNAQDASATNGWATAMTPNPATNQAVEFTVTIGAGKTLDLSFLSFAAQTNDANGPKSVNAYISTNNFASSTQLGSTLTLTGTTWGVFDFTDAATTLYTGTVAIRLVPFNGTTGNVQFEFDEIWLGGALAAAVIPEAPAWALGGLAYTGAGSWWLRGRRRARAARTLLNVA